LLKITPEAHQNSTKYKYKPDSTVSYEKKLCLSCIRLQGRPAARPPPASMQCVSIVRLRDMD